LKDKKLAQIPDTAILPNFQLGGPISVRQSGPNLACETTRHVVPTKLHQFRFIVSALWRKLQILPRIVLLLQTLKIWGNPSQVSTARTLKPIADNRQVLAVWPTMKVYTNSENLVKKVTQWIFDFWAHTRSHAAMVVKSGVDE